jgi:integrase/transcription elongation factor Elf1
MKSTYGGEAGFHGGASEAHTRQSGLNGGKLDNQVQPHQPPIQPSLSCPECGSKKLWKDGLRCLKDGGTVQRWLCRNCGLRFSESAAYAKVKLNVSSQMLESSNSGENFAERPILNVDFPGDEAAKDPSLPFSEDVSSHSNSLATIVEKHLNSLRHNNRNRRVRVSEGGMKNLAEAESRSEKWAEGATERQSEADVKGKLLEFAWWLKKNGCSEKTIEVYTTMLRLLIKARCNLLDPESVKDYLAKSNKSNGWKALAVAVYTAYLKMHRGTWEPPSYRAKRRLPFIPFEREIDDLIVGCGRRTGAFLQLLKETGMRAGEALRLKWKDVDMERRLIILNETEKGGNPRIFNLSPKLISMLNALPRTSQKLFNCTYSSLKSNFFQSRRRLARKLDNPRLLQIHFHTLRHWKATMEYHKTKDILHVKEILGHTTLDTTLLYIQLDKALFKETSDEFTVNVAKTPEEIKALLEVGFEYVCEKNGLMFFRKRK